MVSWCRYEGSLSTGDPRQRPFFPESGFFRKPSRTACPAQWAPGTVAGHFEPCSWRQPLEPNTLSTGQAEVTCTSDAGTRTACRILAGSTPPKSRIPQRPMAGLSRCFQAEREFGPLVSSPVVLRQEGPILSLIGTALLVQWLHPRPPLPLCDKPCLPAKHFPPPPLPAHPREHEPAAEDQA